MSIAKKLQHLTRYYNLSELSRAVGMSQGHVSGIVRGTKGASLEKLREIASELGIDFGWLVDDSKSWPPVRVAPRIDREPIASGETRGAA